jgi:hypothetical protein
MRISVDPNDRGFSPLVKSKRFMVKVNGEEQKYCITADTELNLAICVAMDGDGFPAFDKARKEFKTVTRFGKIEITETEHGEHGAGAETGGLSQ